MSTTSKTLTPSAPAGGFKPAKLGRWVLMGIGIFLLLTFAVVQVVPFVMTIANSFKCLPATREAPGAFIPSQFSFIDCRDERGAALPLNQVADGLTFKPSLEGYNQIAQYNFGLWFGNTIFYAVAVTVARVTLDSLAGYALARIPFPGRRATFYLVLGTLMIPGVVLLIPRFIILRELGLLGTYQGVIIALAADAFGIFLMKQFFESVPAEIEEAAMVDGASRITIFWRIILPMATPALTALTIFSFQGTWNNFMDVLIIIGQKAELWNLPLGMAQLRGQFGDTLEWNTFLAGAVFTTLPMALLFFFFQRYFVEGTAYSGLKG